MLAMQLLGEEAILIGAAGRTERITAEEVARRLGTINYEVTCALTPRVPRSITATAKRSMSDGLEVGPRGACAGRPAWLVGGAVRDRVLGRPLTDLDLVVDGDPEQAARAIARAAGRAACFALSEDFGAWRVVARDRSVAGGHRAAARRLVRGGPRAARLHGQRDRRADRRGRADRSAGRARGPDGAPPAYGRRGAPSPTILCGCCAWCGSRSSWSSSPSADQPRARAHRRAS